MLSAALQDTHDRRVRDARLARAIDDQRAFLHRIPDPDTRERAEGHLIQLMEMRAKLDHNNP